MKGRRAPHPPSNSRCLRKTRIPYPPRSEQAAAASSLPDLPDSCLPYGRTASSRLTPLRRRHTCTLRAPSLPETLAGAHFYLPGFEELFLFINILLICNVIYNLLWTH